MGRRNNRASNQQIRVKKYKKQHSMRGYQTHEADPLKSKQYQTFGILRELDDDSIMKIREITESIQRVTPAGVSRSRDDKQHNPALSIVRKTRVVNLFEQCSHPPEEFSLEDVQAAVEGAISNKPLTVALGNIGLFGRSYLSKTLGLVPDVESVNLLQDEQCRIQTQLAIDIHPVFFELLPQNNLRQEIPHMSLIRFNGDYSSDSARKAQRTAYSLIESQFNGLSNLQLTMRQARVV